MLFRFQFMTKNKNDDRLFPKKAFDFLNDDNDLMMTQMMTKK